MTHNMKIKYPFYISENPFIYSLFHTAGFVSHTQCCPKRFSIKTKKGSKAKVE